MAERFAFERRWGAEVRADGSARFRIWAPSQEKLWLVPARSGQKRQMLRSDEGWFEVVTDDIAVGGGYQFELGSGRVVPDPAARAQMSDVHGASRLVDPRAYEWRTVAWSGRPWHEAVVYELHTGTFTEQGTFDGVRSKLDYLADLGITALELMPVAQFSGDRGWGYDGVLLYAPHVAYGGPEGLKRLVDAAHERGIMVLLDVVYNHFGPDGNYLSSYAPEFFHPERDTPWGAAIAYEKSPVRSFFIENALYWLEEYRFDGFRFDAIDQIQDEAEVPILEELATEIRSGVADRYIHLTTEDDRNITGLHEREDDGEAKLYTAEWNDDFHHAAHVVATGETDGYYADYTSGPVRKLARALAEGYIYQGQPSPYRDNVPRGEPSDHMRPTAFVNFLQNHDQIGNRALGERLADLAEPQKIAALTAVLLLSPQIPLLYMGEEWGETRPFYFFTDFHGELGEIVREGRRNEFRKWESFQDPANRERIPDPNALGTFEASFLDWSAPAREPNRQRLEEVFRLLDIRRKEIVPRLRGIRGRSGQVRAADDQGIVVEWQLGDGSRLTVYANLGTSHWAMPGHTGGIAHGEAAGRLIFATPGAGEAARTGFLPPWSVLFHLTAGANGGAADGG